MRQIILRHYGVYALLGCLFYLGYGFFDYFYLSSFGEFLWARWLGSIGIFIFITVILRLSLTRKFEEVEKIVESAKHRLEESYKLNMQVAHDLRSPLSTISDVVKKLKYENPKLSRLLESSVEQIKSISGALLADPQEEKIDGDVDFFDLENSISQIIHDKREEYKEVPHFFIMYRVTAPVIGKVKLPKMDFYRVLSNIINNGVEAMENQREKRIKIVIAPREDKVSLLICDNGPGISQDKKELIFKEYISSKAQRDGLGLSFVKTKVEEWGGTIHLKSTSSEGSTFELIIPYG